MREDTARREGLRTPSTVLFWILVALMLLLGTWARFSHITEGGFGHGDAMSHWKHAKAMLDGAPTLAGRFNPLHWVWGAVGLFLVGETDYALKVVSASFDVLNMLLMLLLGYRTTKNKWGGLAAMALYSFTPQIILFARWSHPHTTARFAGLLAFWAFLNFYEANKEGRTARIAWLCLAGLIGGMAMATHPTMAFMGPAYILVIFIIALSVQGRPFWPRARSFVGHSFLFTSCFFVLMTFFGLLYYVSAGQNILEVMARKNSAAEVWTGLRLPEITKAQKYEPGPLQLAFDLILVGSRLTAWSPNTYQRYPRRAEIYGGLFLLCFPLMVVWALRKGRIPFPGYAIPIVVFVYCLGLGTYLEMVYLPSNRYFTHIYPFILLTVVFWIFEVSADLVPRRGATLVSVLACGILFAIHPKLLPGNPQLERKLHFSRALHDQIGDQVNPNSRLLILPYEYNQSHERFLRFPLYFGDDVLHISEIPYTGESLAEMCWRMNVGYVFHSTSDRVAWIRGWKPDFSRPDFYGLYHGEFKKKGDPYSHDKERALILEFLAETQAQRVFESRAGAAYQIDATPGSKALPPANLLDAPHTRGKSWHIKGEGDMEELSAPPTLMGNAVSEAYKLTLGPNASIRKADEVPVTPGETAVASIWLWADESMDETGLRLHVFQNKNKADAEGQALRISSLGAEPTQYVFSHTFVATQDGVIMLLVNRAESTITFYMAAPSLTRLPAVGKVSHSEDP